MTMRQRASIVLFVLFLFITSITHASSSSPSAPRHSFFKNAKRHGADQLGQWELLQYNPQTNQSATVFADGAGNTRVRFSVLTSRIIRVETSASSSFEDRTTLAIVNRMLPTPQFSSQVADGILTITTDDLTLKYTIGTTFTESTLTITSNNPSSDFTGWYYGKPDTGNLLGTIKSLDLAAVLPLNCTQLINVTVHDESLHCEWALISRDGWSIVNDSTNYALDSQYWWDGPNSDIEDFYFFGFGHDYAGAFSDFVKISGRVPLVPRYSLGVWWSRWYDINNFDTEGIVNAYETRALPLDVFIYDMDWHTKYYWGGYTFDGRLFPEPQDTLGYLHSRNLRVAANLHDADGVRKTDAMHDALATYLGLNPSTTGDIPFSILNSTYVYGVEDVVLSPLEKAGMDFWWIDYQQGGTTGGGTGEKQNPTIWTDKVRVTNSLRRGQNSRGLTLARWGGLGNHRYQVGFSGDVFYLSWITLAYQPYFTLTAANVAYGYWSHDFVGNDDHELHTRWLQWGSYSPIFRTHDRGMASGACADDSPSECAIVEIWKLPNSYFEINRAAMQTRAALIPYIYTAARAAFDSGWSLLRPMYHTWPDFDMAYAANTTNFGQYSFGPDMIVSPIVAPADNSTNMANWAVWLPPAVLWHEKDTGMYYRGGQSGQILTKNYDLSEIPVYIFDGSIIPSVPVITGDTIGKAGQQYTELIFTVYEKETQSAYTEVYEDDGYTFDYITKAAYAVTTVNYSRTAELTEIAVETIGSFPELPATRTYTFRLINTFPPSSVKVNGVVCSYVRFPSRQSTNIWSYDGPELTTVIRVMGVATNAPLTIQIVPSSGDTALLYGLKGALNHARLAKLNLDEDWTTPGCQDTQNQYLMSVASTGNQLSFLAGTDLVGFTNVITSFPANYQNAIAEVQALHTGISKARVAYSLALLQSASFWG